MASRLGDKKPRNRKSSIGSLSQSFDTSTFETEERVLLENSNFFRRLSNGILDLTIDESLKDEVFDIMPKTDYTYARSGSYSSSKLNEPYVSPNMSRRRLRGNVNLSPEAKGLYSNSRIIENTETTEYSTVQSTTNNSYNIGSSYLELNNRLGENLNNSYTERVQNSRNRMTSSHDLNEVEESYDEYEDDDSDGVDYADNVIRDPNPYNRRRYMDTDDGMVLRSGSHLHGVKSVIDAHGEHASDKQSDVSVIPLSSSKKNRINLNKSNHNNETTYFATTSTVSYSSSSTQSDLVKRKLNYNYDEGNMIEKAAYETSEKSLRRRSGRLQNASGRSQNSSITVSSINHMYGLDSDEESDDQIDGYTVSSKSSAWSSDETETFTETIITTITTIYTFFSNLAKPILKPVAYVFGSPVKKSSKWLWRKFSSLISYFILLDLWILRRRQFCCICVPLCLLLLPLLLLGGYYGKQMIARSNILPLFWVQRDQTVIHKVAQFDTYNLNEKVQQIVLQLQGKQSPPLSQADIEVIIRGILDKELTALRLDLVGKMNHAKADMSVQNLEYNQKLSSLESLLAAAEIRASSLEKDLSEAKLFANLEGEQVNTETLLRIQKMEEQLRLMNLDIGTMKNAHIDMMTSVQNCCRNDSFYALAARKEVNSILGGIIGGGGAGTSEGDSEVSSMFMSWLHGNYISKAEFDKRMQALADDITAKILEVEKRTSQQVIIQSENTQSFSGRGEGLSETYVRSLVEESLLKFSADKTGMADYALESAGASVISTRCSETYYPRTALVSIFGIPLYYSSNSPRTVIQPDVNPGECWPFRGKKGYMVIQLVRAITPSGFTLEHIPKSLSNTGDIKSAPKDFTVYGLDNEGSDSPVSLGNYTYNDNGPSVQFFPIQKHNPGVFKLIELRILDNYGHKEFTCLYRFRVHGTPTSE